MGIASKLVELIEQSLKSVIEPTQTSRQKHFHVASSSETRILYHCSHELSLPQLNMVRNPRVKFLTMLKFLKIVLFE